MSGFLSVLCPVLHSVPSGKGLGCPQRRPCGEESVIAFLTSPCPPADHLCRPRGEAQTKPGLTRSLGSVGSASEALVRMQVSSRFRVACGLRQ